jgi:hypothetical protein
MIEKLPLEKRTNQFDQADKLDELIEAVNNLGKTVDEFTGSAPEYRYDPKPLQPGEEFIDDNGELTNL